MVCRHRITWLVREARIKKSSLVSFGISRFKSSVSSEGTEVGFLTSFVKPTKRNRCESPSVGVFYFFSLRFLSVSIHHSVTALKHSANFCLGLRVSFFLFGSILLGSKY